MYTIILFVVSDYVWTEIDPFGVCEEQEILEEYISPPPHVNLSRSFLTLIDILFQYEVHLNRFNGLSITDMYLQLVSIR